MNERHHPMNVERAEQSEQALIAYCPIFKELSQDDREIVCSDLLCALMHWCHQRGVDFEDVRRLAGEHFYAEAIEPDDITMNEMEIWAKNHPGSGW